MRAQKEQSILDWEAPDISADALKTKIDSLSASAIQEPSQAALHWKNVLDHCSILKSLSSKDKRFAISKEVEALRSLYNLTKDEIYLEGLKKASNLLIHLASTTADKALFTHATYTRAQAYDDQQCFREALRDYSTVIKAVHMGGASSLVREAANYMGNILVHHTAAIMRKEAKPSVTVLRNFKILGAYYFLKAGTCDSKIECLNVLEEVFESLLRDRLQEMKVTVEEDRIKARIAAFSAFCEDLVYQGNNSISPKIMREVVGECAIFENTDFDKIAAMMKHSYLEEKGDISPLQYLENCMNYEDKVVGEVLLQAARQSHLGRLNKDMLAYILTLAGEEGHMTQAGISKKRDLLNKQEALHLRIKNKQQREETFVEQVGKDSGQLQR